MFNWLHGIVQKAAAVVVMLLAPVAGLVVQPQTDVIPQEIAIVSEAMQPFSILSLPEASSTDASTTLSTINFLPLELATVTPGLLPKATLRPLKQAQTATQTPKPKPKPKPTPAPIAVAGAQQKEITADWLIERTDLSFKTKRDGPYEAVLTTNLGNKKMIQWGLSDANIGGNSSLPKFAVSFSCDPPPEIPLPDDIAQAPFFKVATSYTCDISLAALTGNDRRARSKRFSFKTESGSVLVRPSSAMNSVLRNDKNAGGFVFTNRDTKPVLVTGITFAATLVGLNTADNPLIARFIDNYTGQTLSEYRLENIPKGTSPYTQNKTGIELPLSFNLEATREKMLSVEVIGVRKFTISGIDPTIKIVIENIRLNRSEVKTVLNSAQLLWRCVVPVTQYDPNSTSGEVCKD